MSDMHDTDSENHTVVIWKIRFICLYSTAWYRLYFGQYIVGYIIKVYMKNQMTTNVRSYISFEGMQCSFLYSCSIT